GIAVDMGKSPQKIDHIEFLYSLREGDFANEKMKALLPIMDSILGDVRKAMLAYRNKYGKNVGEILISGEYAHIPGISGYFGERLGVKTGLANPWKARAITNVPEELEARAAGFTVVTGLALRSVL